MTPALRTLLVAAHFVCPLLFFTNLTRNPYVTQISLLNICLALAAALWLWRETALTGSLALPKTPVDLPLLAMAGAALLSWSVACALHADFFRPAIFNEGLRAALFLTVNCLAVFYLSSSLEGADDDVPLGAWAVAAVVWGLLWLGFSQVRGPARPLAVSPFDLMWDGYGAFLWLSGLAGTLWLCRRGRAVDFLHLAFAVGFLASIYGVMQYFNREIIWPHVLNPYGGRSVSTFGNPNFLSSYNVVLFPLALDRFLRSRGAGRGVYAAVLLALEAALLCSMTRSSWLGAFAAVALLAFSPDLRARARTDARPVGLLACLGLAMVLFWPASSIASGYTPSVLGRLAEVKLAAGEPAPYSPWHQRLLIWSSAWLMGAENPLTGKGFGLFELFYPFYQGQVIDHSEFLRPLRTHANNSHNELLETWAQGGLLGLGILLWLWTTFARAAAGRGRTAFAAACGVGGMLIDNLLNVSLHFAVPAFMFWWAAGLALPACGRRVLLSATAARTAAAAVLLAAAACSWQWIRVWNREVLYFTGFKLLKQKALIPAVRVLENSRAWGPPEVNALYELGNAYAQSERYEEAQRSYLEAIEANSGYDEIYYNRGAILASRLGRREEAIKHFELAVHINPRSNEAYNNLSAQYFTDVPRYGGKARALLEKALRHYPNDPSHWHNLGFLHVQTKDWARAEDAFTRALRISPDFRASESSLLAIQRETGKRPPMLDSLAQMRELDARIKRQDFSDSTLRLGLELASRLPEVEKVRFLAGSLLLVRGRAQESLEHLEWLVKRSPRHSSAQTNLGAAYQSLGRREEAASAYRAALAAEPGNAQARSRLESLGLVP
jgi:tetratricopeptide (TPR) repeat protein/O-antigen ligase